MTVTVEFDQGHTDILRFDFQGRWTWQELLESIAESIRMGDVNARNDVIVNLDNANYLPSGALEKLRNISRNTPMNGGMYVIVGVNSVVSALLEVFRRVYPEGRAWRVARTLDDARALITRDRTSVKNDSA